MTEDLINEVCTDAGSTFNKTKPEVQAMDFELYSYLIRKLNNKLKRGSWMALRAALRCSGSS